jgi:hypothetical protein
MKKNKKIIIGIVLLIICLGLVFAYKNIQKQNINSIRIIPPPDLPTQAGLPLHKGEEKKSLDVSFKDDTPGETNVYDFMNRLRSEGKITFTEKNYIGMGKFIDSINGVKNNQNQSWIYYVNGVEASVGVSNYKIKVGDIVSWKYEKSNY